MRTLITIVLLMIWACFLACNVTAMAKGYRDGDWVRFGLNAVPLLYAALAASFY